MVNTYNSEEVEKMMHTGVSIEKISELIIEAWKKNKNCLIERVKNDKDYIAIYDIGMLRRWLTPYFLSKSIKLACKQINKELTELNLDADMIAYAFINKYGVDSPTLFCKDYLTDHSE